MNPSQRLSAATETTPPITSGGPAESMTSFGSLGIPNSSRKHPIVFNIENRAKYVPNDPHKDGSVKYVNSGTVIAAMHCDIAVENKKTFRGLRIDNGFQLFQP